MPIELGSFADNFHNCGKVGHKQFQCQKQHSRTNQPQGAHDGQQGKYVPRNGVKRKLHQIEFLGENSGTGMAGGESGAFGQTGSLGVQKNGAT